MNGKLLVVIVLVLYGVAVSPVAAQQAPPRKKQRVIKQEPAGDYERCDEDCPPPGISAAPSEIWCVTRVQCTSQNGCGCRLCLVALDASPGLHPPRLRPKREREWKGVSL
jgi:hypothetical protein